MKSILITGGTGSFGQAFVQRLMSHTNGGFQRVIVYSRGEISQFDMSKQYPLDAKQEDPRMRFFIGDVRDKDRLRRAMDGVDTVIHAAALKRIEVGHYNPGEMIKTNVIGSMNVIEAATDAGVKKVVALSTDKAYQPVSAYGQSKALAESLFLAANNTRGKTGPIFAVTRYGNVSGSAGSVIPIWRQGGRDMTNPDCTRFWMTMDEAVDLVLKAIREMKGGELFIPDLPAYRLGDLAKAMDVLPVALGLPDHEKMHECMEAGNCSDTARRMSVDEIKKELKNV